MEGHAQFSFTNCLAEHILGREKDSRAPIPWMVAVTRLLLGLPVGCWLPRPDVVHTQDPI